MFNTKFKKIIFLGLIAFVSLTHSFAQQKNSGKGQAAKRETDKLYNEILLADSLLFNAFNICDSTSYKEFFTEDLEFYHDIGGLTVSLKSELKSFKEMCARSTRVRRELVTENIDIHPLKDYGAVQIGRHNFYFTNPGKPERLGGTYSFVHVWKKVNGTWKISRVISYGHKVG